MLPAIQRWYADGNMCATKVSVVMATCQGGRYLEPQLRSILAQDIALHEIIISDDASTDSTVEFLQALAREHAHVLPVLSPQRVGINGNFSRAIMRASGDLILVADQDDIWEPGKARALVNAWQGEDVLYSDGSIIDGEDRPVADSELTYFRLQPVQGLQPHYFLFNNCVSGHNMALARDFAQHSLEDGVPVGMMYDQWLALLASLGRGVGYVDGRLCQHRIHGGNAHNNRELKRSRRDGKLASHHRKCDALHDLAEKLLAKPKLQEDIRELMKRLSVITAVDSRCIFSFATFITLYRLSNLIWPNGEKNVLRKIRNLSIGRAGGIMRYL